VNVSDSFICNPENVLGALQMLHSQHKAWFYGQWKFSVHDKLTVIPQNQNSTLCFESVTQLGKLSQALKHSTRPFPKKTAN
jgi:hypothetical protein